jgi:hypothetical protein
MKRNYMKRIIIIFVVGLLTQQITQAQGTTYLSNVGQASTGSLAVGSNSWYAALFFTGYNANGYMLNSIQLGMTDTSGSPSGFMAMLYAENPLDVAGISPGSNIGTLNGSLDPVAAGIYTYTAPSNLTLLPGTAYFIVLTDGTAIANGAYESSLAGTYSYNSVGGWGVGSDHGSVGVFYSSLAGSSWIANYGNLQFAIDASPIPEPSSSFLLLLGSGVAVYVRRALRR